MRKFTSLLFWWLLFISFDAHAFSIETLFDNYIKQLEDEYERGKHNEDILKEIDMKRMWALKQSLGKEKYEKCYVEKFHWLNRGYYDESYFLKNHYLLYESLGSVNDFIDEEYCSASRQINEILEHAEWHELGLKAQINQLEALLILHYHY